MSQIAISDLPRGLTVSDSVVLHFRGGETLTKTYAGILKGSLSGRQTTEEYLFVNSSEEIGSCRETRKYLKVSHGFTPSYPGRRLESYTRLEKHAKTT